MTASPPLTSKEAAKFLNLRLFLVYSPACRREQ
jgi:hypothetical protein